MSAQTYADYAPKIVPLGGLFGMTSLHEIDGTDDSDDIFDLPWEPQPVAAAPEEEEVAEEIIIEEPDDEPQPPGMVTLWPHQEIAVNNVLAEFKRKVKRTLVVAATGSGKSVMISDLTRRAAAPGHGVLILVHRDELIRQLARSVGRVGIAPLIEKAQERALGGFGLFSKVVVASVQTMRGKRLESWPKDAFKLAIVDECFPAGTLVDGASIESIRAGDFVNSFNHQTSKIEARRVVRLFKNPVKKLVRVHLSDGRKIVCTPEHPFAVQTPTGITYLPAVSISGYTVMQKKDVIDAKRDYGNYIRATSMRDVPNGFSAASREASKSLLQTGLHSAFSPRCSLLRLRKGFYSSREGDFAVLRRLPEKTSWHYSKNLRGLQQKLQAQKLELDHDSDLFSGVQGNPQTNFAKANPQSAGIDGSRLSALLQLRRASRVQGPPRKEAIPLLFRGMQAHVFEQTQFGNNGAHQSQTLFGANEAQQSDGKTGSQKSAIGNTSRDGMETQGARRQQKRRLHQSAENDGRWVGLADGSQGDNSRPPRWTPFANVLQNRRSKRGTENRGGSGRGISPNDCGQRAGRAQDGVFRGARVVRVEVLERRSGKGFGEVCPDGFVYNIEIEGNHNYFVGGVLVHNCHHCLGQSYRDVLNHFGMEEGRLRVAGFTATADRLDGENIGQVFESLAFEYNIQNATRDGWLVPIEALQLKTDPPINLKDLRTTAGDFNQGDLERAVNDNIGVLVNALVDTNALEKRRTICFTPNISSARAMAQALSDVGISAQAVAGADLDRAAKFKAHQNGEFQVLCNCAVATEGYDDRLIQAVLICRPTKSRALYSQMVGRGTRLPEEGDPAKTNCRVVDFAFLTGKHKLVSPVDLYDNSQTPDEVVEAAREILESGGVQTLDVALELAQAEYEESRRVRIQRRVVSVKASKFDPLTACDVYGIPQKLGASWENTESCSEKQAMYLQKRAISTEGMTKATASKLISKMEARKEHGWSNPWQVRDLIQSGIDPQAAIGMRETEAQSYLSANPIMASAPQVGLLRRLGVSEAEASLLTKREAMERITALKQGNASG